MTADRITILFLAANPVGTDRLRLDEEVRTIDERLWAARYRDRFKLVTHWAVRVSDLSKYLLRHQPQIVHFSGYGLERAAEGAAHGGDGGRHLVPPPGQEGAVGQIILEDGDGRAKPISPAALAGLFRTLRDNVRCVVLNACFSATQAEAISGEIDCVVGMSRAIGDPAAIRFAAGFYQGLGYGRSVQTAFELGKNEIGLAGLAEESTPQLLVKTAIDAASMILLSPEQIEAVRIRSLGQSGAGAHPVGQRGAPPRAFRVPVPRNPNLTGRETLLADLRAALTSGQAGAGVQALVGMGGVGKTQLAAEYAFRHRDSYAVVWWLPTEEPAVLTGAYAELAEPLGIPSRQRQDLALQVEEVRGWLEGHGDWLLIFDNAREPAALADYLPRGGAGHVLITSTNPAWGRIARTRDIDPLPPEAAADFLMGRMGHADRAASTALAKELDGLPLALEQAAAYLELTGLSATSYLELFRSSARTMLDRDAPLDHRGTVAATFDLSFQEVQQASPAGAELLQLCAYLAPDDISPALVRRGKAYLPALAGAVEDPLALYEAVAALRRYSLIRGAGDTPLAVHRLVQAVVRAPLEGGAQNRWPEVALLLVCVAFPQEADYLHSWPDCARLLPHGLAAVGHANRLKVAPNVVAGLQTRMGRYLLRQADFRQARPLLERALAINETAQGPDHPVTAASLNNLATVLREQGDYPAARPLLERALAIRERALDPDHPDVATSLNNLAGLLRDQEDYPAARPLLERALRAFQRCGNRHREAVAFYRLGQLAARQGRPGGGARLVALSLLIDRDLGHHDALDLGEVERLVVLFEAGGPSVLLEEAKRAYHADRGWGLVAAAFDGPLARRGRSIRKSASPKSLRLAE